MSWKEVQDKFGAEEAKARIRSGSMKARRDPQDRRFWQFMTVLERAEDSMQRRKSAGVATSAKVNQKTLSKVSSALNDCDFEDLDEAEKLFDKSDGEAHVSEYTR